jgi:hypothetical protein
VVEERRSDDDARHQTFTRRQPMMWS